MAETCDVAVLGLGATGAAALFQLARRGARVIGIDQFAPPHDRGSSHGETRITRLAIGEGEELVPLAMRSHEIWRDVEERTGELLLTQCGCLLIADPRDATRRHGRTGFLARTIDAARRFGIAHELLDASEIRYRRPQFRVEEFEVGYFEPSGGYVRPEACIRAQLRLASEHGATLRLDERVTQLRFGQDAVQLVTTRGSISAGQVVVAAGAWAGGLLGSRFAPLLRPTRQLLHWLSVEEESREQWTRSPVYIWMHGDGPFDFFYGFPSLGGEVKSATETDDDAGAPDALDRRIAPQEAPAFVARHHVGRLDGLGAVTRSAACLYTQTPDGGFVIDVHPECARILIASPCSGHGFKHSAAIGEAVAEKLLDGESRIGLRQFALSRFL